MLCIETDIPYDLLIFGIILLIIWTKYRKSFSISDINNLAMNENQDHLSHECTYERSYKMQYYFLGIIIFMVRIH